MSTNSNALWDKLVTPVILMVLAFMATWVFTINTDVAVMKKSMESVDKIAMDQRTAEKMMVLLEQQNKVNAELVTEVKNNQEKMTDAIIELRVSFTRLSTMWPPSQAGQDPKKVR